MNFESVSSAPPPNFRHSNVISEGSGKVVVDVEEDRSQTKRVSECALQSYNEKHGSKYEFVEGLCSNEIIAGGVWYHTTFKAKDKSVSGEDSPTNIFFAELKATKPGYDVIACRILDGPEQVAGCHKSDDNLLCSTSVAKTNITKYDFTVPPPEFRWSHYKPLPKGWGEVSEEERSQTKKMYECALQSYNEKHGSNYEFIRAWTMNEFNAGGVWYHVNFKAQDKSVSGEESPVKLLFAELKVNKPGYDVTACQVLDGVCEGPNQIAGCHECDIHVLHPPSGFQKGRLVRDMDQVSSPHKRPRNA